MSIDLSFRSLVHLDASLNLSNYQIINLRGNNFKCEQPFLQQLRIQHLNLSYNNLDKFWALPQSLITLEINNNLLSNLTNIHLLINLKQIDLSNNLITSLHWFAQLNQLTHLYLKNNKITSIEHIKVLLNLQEVDLESNELRNQAEIALIDTMPRINIANFFGNPLFDTVQLKNLCHLEKNCHCKSPQAYANSELAKKRAQLDEFDVIELDEPVSQQSSQKKAKSLSPLSKMQNPQFYDPKASKYVTFQEVLKQKQREQKQLHQQQLQQQNITTNTTINSRQVNQNIEQLTQANKQLISEKFKLQQKLQTQIRENDEMRKEIDHARLQIQAMLAQLGNQVEDEYSLLYMINQLEMSISEQMKDATRHSGEMVNSLMKGMMSRVKMMNTSLEQQIFKKHADFLQSYKHLQFKFTRLQEYVYQQQQTIQKLSKQRVHSPQLRQCLTSRHSKNPTELDQQKLKNLFFKSPGYQIEKPLKTQGPCSMVTAENSKRSTVKKS